MNMRWWGHETGMRFADIMCFDGCELKAGEYEGMFRGPVED